MRASYPRYRRRYGPTPLGTYLKDARKKAEMSQAELARKIGVSRPVISRLESGEYLQPSPVTLKRLSEVFDITLADLHTMVGYTPPSDLPELNSYLHAKYNLPDEAIHELVAYFEFIRQRYIRMPETTSSETDRTKTKTTKHQYRASRSTGG